jgi:hypothetical protein
MKKIATIRTKFDLSKTWRQRSNYLHSLEKHKEEWEEVLVDSIEDLMNVAVKKVCPAYQEPIQVSVVGSRTGCIEIIANICIDLNDTFLVKLIIELIVIFGPGLRKIFAKKLNEKAKKLFDLSPQLSQSNEEIIEVINFEITPAGDSNDPNAN